MDAPPAAATACLRHTCAPGPARDDRTTGPGRPRRPPSEPQIPPTMPPTTDTAPPPGETTFASVLLLLSGFLLWSAHGISGFASTVSAGAFPMGAAAVMVVCALMFVHRAARRPGVETDIADRQPAPEGAPQGLPSASGPGDTPAAPAGWRRVMPPVLLWNTLALAGYMLALERAGFHLASLIFLLLSMRLLGSRRWGLNAAVAVGAVAAIHLVFQTVFSVVLPAGTLWQG